MNVYFNNRYFIKLKYFWINHFFIPLSLSNYLFLLTYVIYGQLIILLPNFASVYKLKNIFLWV